MEIADLVEKYASLVVEHKLLKDKNNRLVIENAQLERLAYESEEREKKLEHQIARLETEVSDLNILLQLKRPEPDPED